jgi:hypothetical protein
MREEVKFKNINTKGFEFFTKTLEYMLEGLP